MTVEHPFIFGGVCVATWFLVIYFWPRMMLYVYKGGSSLKGSETAPSRLIRSTRNPKHSLQIPFTHRCRPEARI